MFDLAHLKEKVGDLKVLYVEDEDDAREAFVDTLKQFFLNITTVLTVLFSSQYLKKNLLKFQKTKSL